MQTALLAAAAAAAAVVSHAWIAAPPMGAPTAAGYATLINRGAAPDTLLGAATPAADKIELHTMSTAGGVMRMRPATGGVALAPGQSLTLQPGGALHFMLVRPHHPLKLGERVPATLIFAKAGAVRATFIVEAPGAPVR